MSVWDQLVGQDRVVQQLQRAVAEPRSMTHAWLFTGPPGSGRSTAARAFAAALQCEHIQASADIAAGEVAQAAGCGQCPGCRETLEGTHADVQIVATQTVNIGVDQVRELVSKAAQSPSRGRYRIIIVEDVDRMLERSSNVLLKSLEEPPSRTLWLLCAPSAQDVLMTIRSRVRQVNLVIPSAQEVAQLLVRNDGVDPEMALRCAQLTQGHIGRARALSRNETARAQRQKIVQLVSGIKGVAQAVFAAEYLVELAKDQAKQQGDRQDATEKEQLLRTLGADESTRQPAHIRAALKTLEETQKKRATRRQRDVLDQALTDMLSVYRDVLVMQLPASVELINAAYDDDVRHIASASTSDQTMQRIDMIQQTRQRLGANVSAQLALEALMVKLRTV